MFVIDSSNKIKIVQGDTGVINLKLSNYNLSDGDEVKFAVTLKETMPLVIEKTITSFEEDGSARITLNGEDTLDLNPGNYLYEIQVKTIDGRIDTVITATKFTIMEGIIYGWFN